VIGWELWVRWCVLFSRVLPSGLKHTTEAYKTVTVAARCTQHQSQKTHSRPAECSCHRARHIACTLRGQAQGLSRGPCAPAGSRQIQQTSSPESACWSCIQWVRGMRRVCIVCVCAREHTGAAVLCAPRPQPPATCAKANRRVSRHSMLGRSAHG